jgi:hypothetical protein
MRLGIQSVVMEFSQNGSCALANAMHEQFVPFRLDLWFKQKKCERKSLAPVDSGERCKISRWFVGECLI